MSISQASIIQDYANRTPGTDGCPGHFTAGEQRKLGRLWTLLLKYLDEVKDKNVKVVGEYLQKIDHDWSTLKPDESPNPNEDPEALTKCAWEQFTKGDNSTRLMGFFGKKKLTREQLILDRYVNETTQQFIDRAARKHVQIVPDEYIPSFAHPDKETRNLRDAFWEAVTIKVHPDIWVHRFLRSSGWDVDKAFAMIKGVIDWRAVEAVDVINRNGELGIGLDELRLGLSQLVGRDRLGSPLMYVRVRRIMPRANEGFVFKRYLVMLFEAMQIITRKYGRVTMLYDFTGFTMDNTPLSMVQFMVLLGMKQYAEVSSVLILMVDSWLFINSWNLIRPFLDTNLSARIVFAKTAEDVRQFVDDDQLPTELGGKNSYKPNFVLPKEGENKMMFDTEGRRAAENEWRARISNFETATKLWSEQIMSIRDVDVVDPQFPCAAKRDDAAKLLGDAELELSKFTRSRNNFERLGFVGSDGCLQMP
ncbi:phosphatidylinositol transfer protein csr1 [Kickxella alabastrina]|uniref:Phosphatidylinositol transfer protein csr1 n=1 Tax=Kickxella alabastrina TaxID=61397 RepID=A0ACC1IDH7_9FUNG|nr:phosphatidylinositol transfer protein csr1 [Kickxella alabastrina]